MHPIAFSIGNLQIHWYGIMAALGFLTAIGILLRLRKRAGFSKDNVLDIGMISLFGGISGARLFYVIEFYDQFKGHPLEILRIDKGGLVFYGGFIVALTVIFFYTRMKKVSFFALLDIFGPAMAVSHAVGRFGCFMQGCCFGKPVPSGWPGLVCPAGSAGAARYPAVVDIALENPSPVSVPLWPTQLMECGANIILGLILLWLLPRLKYRGQGASAYLIGYGLIRFCVEGFRGDSHPTYIFNVLTPAQAIGLFIMIPLGIVFFIIAGKMKRNAAAG